MHNDVETHCELLQKVTELNRHAATIASNVVRHLDTSRWRFELDKSGLITFLANETPKSIEHYALS